MCPCSSCRRQRIVLTPTEVRAAHDIERQRFAEDVKTNRKPRYGASHATVEERLKIGMQGARYEAAFASHLGVRHVKGHFAAPDVAGYHVRGTEYGDGRLILHPSDDDNGIYVLVTELTGPVLGPQQPGARAFAICGWIRGRVGKDRRWWTDPQGQRPAFFVPQSALADIRALPKLPPLRKTA